MHWSEILKRFARENTPLMNPQTMTLDANGMTKRTHPQPADDSILIDWNTRGRS